MQYIGVQRTADNSRIGYEPTLIARSRFGGSGGKDQFRRLSKVGARQASNFGSGGNSRPSFCRIQFRLGGRKQAKRILSPGDGKWFIFPFLQRIFRISAVLRSLVGRCSERRLNFSDRRLHQKKIIFPSEPALMTSDQCDCSEIRSKMSYFWVKLSRRDQASGPPNEAKAPLQKSRPSRMGHPHTQLFG